MDKALLYSNCLSDLANCTARQLELLQKIKSDNQAINKSSHILNELLYHKSVLFNFCTQNTPDSLQR